MKNIAIHGRYLREGSRQDIVRLFDQLHERKVNIQVSEMFADQNSGFPRIADFERFTHEISGKVDAIFSIGGDGTILETLTMVGSLEYPIVGINTGRLGFLATISRDQIDKALDHIFDGQYTIDKRSLLYLETEKEMFGGKSYALNEFSILRRETSSMITIRAYLDGDYINTYWADGLMVATPTGSTGYSLSCGGPILVPHTKNFVITPVSPHNLNVRPLIVPDSSELTFEVESRNTNYLISLDSRSRPVGGDFSLKVKKAYFSANLIKIPGDNYMDSLKNKLSWGLDKRN